MGGGSMYEHCGHLYMVKPKCIKIPFIKGILPTFWEIYRPRLKRDFHFHLFAFPGLDPLLA